jgi:DNA-binding Lrp family transcriptional regulator
MSDLLDVQLLHALQIDGRAPFSLIAKVLGISDQTVARRYNRLRSAGLLRVRGLLEPSKAGRTQWIVRIRCTPSAASTIAEALARRADTSWISLTAGGTEIVCVVSARNDVDRPVPVLEKLPLSRGVLTIDAHCVLHEFFGGTMSLINKNGPLTAAQIEALRPVSGESPSRVRALDATDEPLLQVLEHDGRATATSLASTTGWSQSTVRRRIAELAEAHLLYFDVDFNQALFDLQMRAVMWLRVPTDRLAAVGKALADHPEVGYVAATTGATNLYSAVSCPSAEALYTYLTERIAHLTCVQHVETAPIMRSVKASSVLAAP